MHIIPSEEAVVGEEEQTATPPSGLSKLIFEESLSELGLPMPVHHGDAQELNSENQYHNSNNELRGLVRAIALSEDGTEMWIGSDLEAALFRLGRVEEMVWRYDLGQGGTEAFFVEEETVWVTGADGTIIGLEHSDTAPPACTGDFAIQAPADLKAIRECTVIQGGVSIDEQAWLRGIDLPLLTEVTGNLDIWNNEGLTQLDGLANLTTVGGEFRLWGNTALRSLDGLANLTTVEDDLEVQSSPKLTHLEGLSGVTRVGGYLEIDELEALTSLQALSGLTEVGGLKVSGNNALTDLDGLSGITSLGSLTIGFNDGLTDLSGLSNLTATGGLDLSGNGALTHIDGLSNVREIRSNLEIRSNDALLNLDALKRVTAVGRRLDIVGNDSLANLKGLSNIVEVADGMSISLNYALTDLKGVAGIRSVGREVQIKGNTALCTSLAEKFAGGVSSRFPPKIADNKPGC